jgi:hypothetical protein
MNEDKIKISYDDLENKKIDKVIAQQLEKSSREKMEKPLSLKYHLYKRWLYLLIAIILSLAIAWTILKIFSTSGPSEKEHFKIDGSYAFLKAANKLDIISM